MSNKKVVKKSVSPWTFRPDDDVLALWKELEGEVEDKTAMINEAIVLYGEDAAEVAEQLGNSEKVLKKDYKALVTPELLAQFLAVVKSAAGRSARA